MKTKNVHLWTDDILRWMGEQPKGTIFTNPILRDHFDINKEDSQKRLLKLYKEYRYTARVLKGQTGRAYQYRLNARGWRYVHYLKTGKKT